MHIFSINMDLEYSPHDIVELDPTYYKVDLLTYDNGARTYRITSTTLKNLVDAIVALCFGNQLEALGMLHKIEGTKGKLYDTPSKEESSSAHHN
jgi:hypothetical protein